MIIENKYGFIVHPWLLKSFAGTVSERYLSYQQCLELLEINEDTSHMNDSTMLALRHLHSHAGLAKVPRTVNLLLCQVAGQTLIFATFSCYVPPSWEYHWCSNVRVTQKFRHIFMLTLTLILFRQPQSRCLVRQLTKTMTPSLSCRTTDTTIPKLQMPGPSATRATCDHVSGCVVLLWEYQCVQHTNLERMAEERALRGGVPYGSFLRVDS